MPKDDATPEKDIQGTPAGGTGSTQPAKITVPGVGDFTASEIAEAIKAKNNERDWRRELSEKGREINEIRRKADQFDNLRQEVDEIKSAVRQPAPPVGDWRKAETLDEKVNLFMEGTEHAIRQRDEKIQKLESQLTAREQRDREANEQAIVGQQIDASINQAVGQFSDKEKPVAKDLLEGYVVKRILQVGRQKILDDPTLIAEFTRTGAQQLEQYGLVKTETYTEAKKKDSDRKVTPPGEAPAETELKIKPGMSKSERMRIINAGTKE